MTHYWNDKWQYIIEVRGDKSVSVPFLRLPFSYEPNAFCGRYVNTAIDS